jgi:hypothetical protein
MMPVENKEAKVIKDVTCKYGWSIQEVNGSFELYNAIGNKVCTLHIKNGNYRFVDNAGKKLMAGYGVLAASVEKLLTQYYYAKLITVN